MSKNITAAQLDANQSIYKLDDYRNMVNYESGTNKGYVRFTMASDGKLKIEKFNNKIDVPLSWRSNVSAAHNKSVRAKFLAAMEQDLRYMGDAGNTIRKMVLAPKKPGEDVESPGKALSRRDVKAILDKFDAQFNTGTGRICILKNFMDAAKIACNFHGTDEEFARDYLKTGDVGIDHRFTDYITSKEGEGVDALPQHQRMVKSEAEFRQLLFRLENLVDDAKQRLSVETTLKSVAKTLANDGGEFGVRFSADAEGKIRAALVKLLDKAGVTDVDLGFGTKNTALEMFIKNVVPILVKECAANIKDLPNQKDEAAIAAALDAELNIDRVFSLAKEFIEGAKAEVEDMQDVPQGGDDIDNYIAGMKQLFEDQMATVKQVAVFCEARKVFVLNMDGGKQTNLALAKEVGSLTPQFVKEAKLDTYTAKFLKSHFAKSVGAVVENEGNFMEKAKQVIENVKIAGQINYGERWQTNPDAKTLKDVKLAAGGDVQHFLGEMGRKTAQIVNEKKGGLPLYEKLMGRTLTAILNQKIRNAADSNGLARIHIDNAAFGEVETRLRRTVDAYCEFRDGKGAVIVEKAVDAFRRKLDRLAKKGNIDQQAYNMLLTDFQNRMKTAFNNATTRFLERTPQSADIDPKEAKEASLTFLTNALNEEKGEVLADMHERIATMVVTRGLNQDVRNELIGKMDERIGECAAKLKEKGVAPKFATDDATMAEALKKLYYKVLADKCGNKAIAGQRIGDNLVENIKDAFYSAAKDLVDKANKLADIVDGECKTMADVAARSLFEAQASRQHYAKDLPKKEYDEMQASLRDDLKTALQTKTDELKRKYLLNPDAYTKKDVGDFKAVGEIFDQVGKDGVYTQDSVTRIFNDIVDARYTTMMAWLYNPTGPEGKGTLEGDMVASEMQRLAEPAAGKAGEYAAKLPRNELNNIVDAAVKTVLANAEKYAISYTTGGKATFMKRIAKEVQSIVNKHVEAQAKFREQFVKDAQPYLQKYVDSLRTEKKDGVQVATDKMNAVLDEISRQKEPPPVKGFALAFDGMLQKLVNDRVDMKMDEFLKYSAKVTAAYDKCIPAFNEAMDAHRAELKAAGATDEDMKFFDEKLAPFIHSSLETDLQRNIDSPHVMNGAAAYGKVMADSFAQQFVTAIKDADMSNNTSLMTMLSDLDMKALYADNDTFNATKSNVETWMKSPAVQKLAVELRQAKMTLAACGETSMCQAAIDARAKVEEFKNELRAALMGLKTTILESAFDEKQVAPALNIFKVWIKQYELPNLRVYVMPVGDMSLEEAAVHHFTGRIAAMKLQLSQNPNMKEPLLSADYIKSFTQYLNKIGRAAMFRELEARLVNERATELVTKQGNYDTYNYVEQHGEDDNAELRKTVTAQNMNDLVKTLTNLLDRTRRTMRDIVVSLEDMKRWGEVIEREFKNMISDESTRLAQLDKFARSRVSMMLSIDLGRVSGDVAIQNYVSNALKEYLGNKDIQAQGTLSEKFINKKKIDIPGLVSHLTDLTTSAVKESANQLKKNAMHSVKSGDTLEPLPGPKDLMAKFKEIAKSTVESVASDKKSPHGAALHAIAKELGIKK